MVATKLLSRGIPPGRAVVSLLLALSLGACATDRTHVPGTPPPEDEAVAAASTSPPLPGTLAEVGALPGGRGGDRQVDLGSAVWERNGRTQQTGVGDGLAFDRRGVHWATVFSIDAPGTYALRLDFEPGPDGCLMELMLDGRRLGLPRDGWRPTRRTIVSEVDARWLGPGGHLLEFVAREEVSEAAVRPRALLLLRQPRESGGAPAPFVDAR